MTLEAPKTTRMKRIQFLQECLELVTNDKDRETIELMLAEELNKQWGEEENV